MTTESQKTLTVSSIIAASQAWQASREHIRSKLQSDEMVEKVAKAIVDQYSMSPRKWNWDDCAKAAIAAVVEEV